MIQFLRLVLGHIIKGIYSSVGPSPKGKGKRGGKRKIKETEKENRGTKSFM